MNRISRDDEFKVLSLGRSKMESAPEEISSKLANAIVDGNCSLRLLGGHFYGGNLAPRSTRYRESRESCEGFIKGYLSWMLDNKWIDRT